MREKKPIESDDIEESLFRKLGGTEAIKAVVNDFYDRMLEDPTVNSAFQGVDMASLRKHQVQFIAYALGGPVTYDRSTLRKAHTDLKITNKQYEATLKHLKASLRKFNVGWDEIAKIEALLRSIKPFIINQ